jgi:Leucine-rich repeat (LRR) protein
MHDLDVIRELRRCVGRDFSHEMEGESVVCLSLASDDFIFGGLIRHHSAQEKYEILLLISRLKQLRKLDLRRCMLGRMPDEMGELVLLKHLDLGSNILGEVPDWIEGIHDLEYLNLGVNRLTALPPFLGKFDNIRTLLLHKNSLSEFPDVFAGKKTSVIWICISTGCASFPTSSGIFPACIPLPGEVPP